MTQNEEYKNLEAEALNAMTTGEAAKAMAVAKLGPKYLPLCPPDHKGVSEQHAKDCSRPGKVPRIANWQLKATDDPSELEKHYNIRPESNLGMTLGGRVGVVGFDADGEYGSRKMEELFGGNIPDTWQFSTPGGGMRYLFRAPKGQKLRKYTDASPDGGHEELAFLADGQMTVIPPSRHQNGGQYLWLPGRGPRDISLADLPDKVLKKMQPSRAAEALFLDSEEGTLDDNESLQSIIEPKPKRIFGAILGKHSPDVPAITDPGLKMLTSKCKVIREFTIEQAGKGCSEKSWHLVTSLLACSGHADAAREFSQLSSKHDNRSDQRIQQMESERENATYGPTRCTTLGCTGDQIARCHGSVNTDMGTGEITNSPAAFLRKAQAKGAKNRSTIIEEKAALLPSCYEVGNYNLCLVQTNKEGERIDVPQANFFAWISKDVVKDDGAEQRRFYEIEGVILSSGKRLPPILVQASEYESMKWLSQWGPVPNIQPGNKARDTVRHAIQSTAAASTQERIFAHLGWIKFEGNWIYLHAGGAVGANNVKVELDSRLKNYVLPDFPSDRKATMQTSLKLLDVAPLRVTLVLWALVFLSPLCEWLRWLFLEPKFLVWLHGESGARKTTLAKLFLCHFGNHLEHPTASFKDTANSLEKRMFDTKDSLILIDDYHPSSSPKDAKAMTQLLQTIIRTVGDRNGRGRMRQDTSLRLDYPPRGMALGTGEDVADGSSSVARLFYVQLLKKDIDLGKLTEAQAEAHMLSQAMLGYLEWIGQTMTQRDDSKIKDLFYGKRNEASHLKVHGRLIEAAAWLYLGLSFGLEYAESVGAITPERRAFLLQEAWVVFTGTADEQGEQVAEVKATKRFVSIVSELLANRSICTESVTALTQGDVPKNGTHVGWEDSNYYYFLPDVLYNTVSRFLSAQGAHFPVSARTLWKELADEGMTHTETTREGSKERRHLLVKKSVRGQRQRLLWIRKDVLQERSEDETQPRSRPEPRHPAATGELQETFAPENVGMAP